MTGASLARLVRRPSFVVGGAVICFWIVCACFGTMIAPHNPLSQQLLKTNSPPSSSHLLGTDQVGRDVLSRVIVAARSTLEIAPLAAALGTIVGTALGLVMGYFGGIVDLLVGRAVDAVLALPVVIVAFIFVVAVGPSTPVLVVVIGFVFAPIISRTVRAAVLVERQLDYIDAARLRGESALRIMTTELFPNVAPTVIVEFTVRLGYAVFTLATLSFLGFGVQPPTPDWGYDISQNYSVLTAGYWWETLFPALAIASLVVAIMLVTDALDEAVGR